MQKEDFTTQVERLINVYGEKAWNEERVKLLWEQFKKESLPNFTKAMDYVIAESFVSPAFSKIASSLPPRENNFTKPEHNWDCSWCGQSGLVSAKKKQTNYTNVFICPCEFGSNNYQQGTNYKLWNKSIYPAFELIPWENGNSSGNPEKVWHKESANKKELVNYVAQEIIK